MDYLNETIVPLSDTDKAMSVEDVQNHLENFGNWELLFDNAIGYYLNRVFRFKDAYDSREFIKLLKDEATDLHHSIGNVTLRKGEVNIWCYSSKINGVHRNDIILAAHADELYEKRNTVRNTVSKDEQVTLASEDSFPASDPPPY